MSSELFVKCTTLVSLTCLGLVQRVSTVDWEYGILLNYITEGVGWGGGGELGGASS